MTEETTTPKTATAAPAAETAAATPAAETTAAETTAAAAPVAGFKSIALAVAAHLLGLFTSIIGAAIIYLYACDQEELQFATSNAGEALNFQLTLLPIYLLLALTLSGFMLIPIVILYATIVALIASVKAAGGVKWRYPFALHIMRG